MTIYPIVFLILYFCGVICASASEKVKVLGELSLIGPSSNVEVFTVSGPTAAPTEAPTYADVIILNVNQNVHSMTVEHYYAQEAIYNKTLQYTVAAALDGVSPDQVVDINAKKGSSASSCTLTYTVISTDPNLWFAVIKEQLVESTTSGVLDSNLDQYATQFGAHNLTNASFGIPQVVNPKEAADGNGKDISDSAMAGIILAGLLFFMALLLSVVICLVGACVKGKHGNKSVGVRKIYVELPPLHGPMDVAAYIAKQEHMKNGGTPLEEQV